MVNIRNIAALALFTLSTYSVAGEQIKGKYETVTESECNFTLVLGAIGHGSFTQSCRREDGSHKDLVEQKPIRWKAQGNSVTVTGLDAATEVFTVHRSLSCQSFGSTGSAFGLRGYQNLAFWKSPRRCK